MAYTNNYNLFLSDDDTQAFLAWREAINGTLDSNMIKIDTVLTEKANKSKVVPIVLLAADWIDGEQTISIDGMTADKNGFISPAPSLTEEEYEASAMAGIYVVSQIDGAITVGTRGTVPTVDIDVEILLLD